MIVIIENLQLMLQGCRINLKQQFFQVQTQLYYLYPNMHLKSLH